VAAPSTAKAFPDAAKVLLITETTKLVVAPTMLTASLVVVAAAHDDADVMSSDTPETVVATPGTYRKPTAFALFEADSTI
jgi:hypothetical protein